MKDFLYCFIPGFPSYVQLCFLATEHPSIPISKPAVSTISSTSCWTVQLKFDICCHTVCQQLTECPLPGFQRQTSFSLHTLDQIMSCAAQLFLPHPGVTSLSALRPQPGVSWENFLSLCKDWRGGRRVDQDAEVETGEFAQTQHSQEVEHFYLLDALLSTLHIIMLQQQTKKKP